MAFSLPNRYQRSMYQLLLHEEFLTLLVDEKEDFSQTVSWLKKFINCSTLSEEIKFSFFAKTLFGWSHIEKTVSQGIIS